MWVVVLFVSSSLSCYEIPSAKGTRFASRSACDYLLANGMGMERTCQVRSPDSCSPQACPSHDILGPPSIIGRSVDTYIVHASVHARCMLFHLFPPCLLLTIYTTYVASLSRTNQRGIGFRGLDNQPYRLMRTTSRITQVYLSLRRTLLAERLLEGERGCHDNTVVISLGSCQATAFYRSGS